MPDCLLSNPEDCDEPECPRHHGGPPEDCLLCGAHEPRGHAPVVDLKHPRPNGRTRIGRVCSAHTLWELVSHGFYFPGHIEWDEESRPMTRAEKQRFQARLLHEQGVPIVENDTDWKVLP